MLNAKLSKAIGDGGHSGFLTSCHIIPPRLATWHH